MLSTQRCISCRLLQCMAAGRLQRALACPAQRGGGRPAGGHHTAQLLHHRRGIHFSFYSFQGQRLCGRVAFPAGALCFLLWCFCCSLVGWAAAWGRRCSPGLPRSVHLLLPTAGAAAASSSCMLTQEEQAHYLPSHTNINTTVRTHTTAPAGYRPPPPQAIPWAARWPSCVRMKCSRPSLTPRSVCIPLGRQGWGTGPGRALTMRQSPRRGAWSTTM